MALTKVNDCRFLNDTEQAQRSAREQLKFIMANSGKLLSVRGGKKYLTVAVSFNQMKENLTPNQLSYVDVIYELTMSGAGFESFKATYKPNKRTFLRYGNGRK